MFIIPSSSIILSHAYLVREAVRGPLLVKLQQLNLTVSILMFREQRRVLPHPDIKHRRTMMLFLLELGINWLEARRTLRAEALD